MANVTQKTIAQRLGINEATVSLALKDHPRVAVRTRESVHAVAREIGYTEWTNRETRGILSRRWNRPARSGIIAVIPAPSTTDPRILRAPYFDAYLRGIEEEAAERDLSILTCPHVAGRLPGIVGAGGIDGVITFSHKSDTMDRLGEIDRPVVLIGTLSNSDDDTVLISDQNDGMSRAAAHLIQLGHRRIAYLGYHVNFRDAILRYEGFRSVMTDAGLLDESLVNCEVASTRDELLTAEIRKLWIQSRGFTALVCYHDVIAMTAIRTLEDMGVSVPRDVSVTGFDDISSGYHFAPAISSVHYDRIEMGRRAVQIIEGSCLQRSEVFPVTFMARGSTAPLSLA